jgi:hypothetical protein
VLAESTRQRAKPFAAFVDEAPDFPVRHFKFQQRERGVGAGPCRQRSLDMCRFARPPQYRKPLAGAFQDLPKQGHCRGIGGLQVPIQWIQFCRLHGTKAHEKIFGGGSHKEARTVDAQRYKSGLQILGASLFVAYACHRLFGGIPTAGLYIIT